MRLLHTAALACTLAAPLAAQAYDGASRPTRATSATGSTADGSTAAGSTAADGSTGTASAPLNPVLLEVGEGVDFEQIEFEMGEGPLLSAWGRVEVDPALIARITDRPRGFVNVITDQGWVARNLPVDTRPALGRAFARAQVIDDGGALPLAFYFDLGAEEPLQLIGAIVAFTEDPVLEAQQLEQIEGLPPATFPLKIARQTISNGLVDGFAPHPGDGLPPAPPNPQIQMPDHLEGFWQVFTPNPVNQDAARNQCAPMAVANALKYMQLTWGPSRGFSAPDPHNKSVGGGIGLAGRLDALTDRTTNGTCIGNGVGYCIDQPGESGFFTGTLAYIEQWNQAALDRITVRYQGDGGHSCANDFAVNTVSGGDDVTFGWLCDRIAAGDGVMLAYQRYTFDPSVQEGPCWPGQCEVKSGGHAIRVHGCGEMGGRPFVRVLNDTRQDRMDEGVCVERDGLESQLVFLEDLDNDGRLNYGDRPLWEVEFALAVSIDP